MSISEVATQPPTVSTALSPRPATPAWSGTFRVERHRIDRPSLQAAWLKDDGSRFVGSGPLSIESDASGNVVGTMDGPLGALRVVGTFADERLDARIEPELAAVHAFSGVVRCPNAKPHAALTCEITASTGDGNWVRSGQADLKPSAGETP